MIVQVVGVPHLGLGQPELSRCPPLRGGQVVPGRPALPEELGVRRVTDRDESALDLDVDQVPGLDVLCDDLGEVLAVLQRFGRCEHGCEQQEREKEEAATEENADADAMGGGSGGSRRRRRRSSSCGDLSVELMYDVRPEHRDLRVLDHLATGKGGVYILQAGQNGRACSRKMQGRRGGQWKAGKGRQRDGGGRRWEAVAVSGREGSSCATWSTRIEVAAKVSRRWITVT